MIALIVLAVAVFYATAWIVEWLDDRPAPAPMAEQTTAPESERPGEQDVLLLVRHRDGGPATGLTLFAVGPGSDDALVLFVPVGTLVDIPGFGLDRLARAQQYGGAALTEASVENLLGIDVDQVATVTNSGLAGLLERAGGLEVEVDRRLVDRGSAGAAQVRFEPGAQILDGRRLAEYWRFRERDEQELASFPRQQDVIEALLDAAAADRDVMEALFDDGAPQLDSAAPSGWIAALFDRLTAAAAADELDFRLLPVEPFGSDEGGTNTTFRPVEGEVDRLLQGPLAASVPTGVGAEPVRVQILNGVGTPGVGQAVDRRLEGGGFQIVLTDNASNFGFEETLILVYDETERSLEAAEVVRERLGVGTIQLSRQPQSIVELTIVVGADFSGTDTPTEPSSTSSSDQEHDP